MQRGGFGNLGRWLDTAAAARKTFAFLPEMWYSYEGTSVEGLL